MLGIFYLNHVLYHFSFVCYGVLVHGYEGESIVLCNQETGKILTLFELGLFSFNLTSDPGREPGPTHSLMENERHIYLILWLCNLFPVRAASEGQKDVLSGYLLFCAQHNPRRNKHGSGHMKLFPRNGQHCLPANQGIWIFWFEKKSIELFFRFKSIRWQGSN